MLDLWTEVTEYAGSTSESFWIHQLDALRYPGLTEDLEFNVFYDVFIMV